jgi:hypothetical protein
MQTAVMPLWRYYSLPWKTRAVLGKLGRSVRLSSSAPLTLEGLLKAVKVTSTEPGDSGVPIYVDPVGLQEAGATMMKPVTVRPGKVPTRLLLRQALEPLGLSYFVKDGLLTITTKEEAEFVLEEFPNEARRP